MGKIENLQVRILSNIRYENKRMARTYNWVLVRDYIMSGTSTAGRTSCIRHCEHLGIDPYGYMVDYPSSYEPAISVDFNGLRCSTAYALDGVIKTLNSALVPWDDSPNCESELHIDDVERLQDQIDNLRGNVWTLLCCFDPDNENYKPVFDEVDRNGGLREFNPKRFADE